MKYLTEINAFYDLVQIKQFSTGQIALWHALMHINNKCSWVEWFTVSNQVLEIMTGLSKNGILKARNILRQYGCIDFKTNGTKATSYKIISIAESRQDSVRDSGRDSGQEKNTMQESRRVSGQDSVRVGVRDSGQVSVPLNRLDKTRLDKTSAADDKDIKILDKAITENLGVVSTSVAQECLTYLDELPADVIEEALHRTARAGGQWNYCKTILDDWVRKKIDTLEKVAAADLKFKAKTVPKTETEEERQARILREMEEYRRNDDGGVYK